MKNRLERGLRTTFIGLAVNTVLAAGKMAAGTVGHSQALVADGVESMADVLSSIVVWRGLIVAAAPADADHPYGHGKAEPLSAAIVAAVLVFAAIAIAVKSIGELLTPHRSPAPFTLVVLIGVVIVKEALFRFVLRQGNLLESSAVQVDAWHHRSDAITSLAAAVGISVSLIGGPGYAAADDAAAIFAAGIIGWNGWRLLRPAMAELMDASPGPTVTDKVAEVAGSVPGVDQVEKCLVRKMGYHLLVDMHIEVDPLLTVERAHMIAHQVKDQVRTALPQVRDVLVHVEPRRGPANPR
ncbi:MAG: cation diffusion facilitator family transporter [Verrucomicrobiia bacterium]